MAVRNINEGISSWNNKKPFPRDRYAITCIEETFGLSKSSDNPMITRVWEISSPETVQQGDKKMNVAGLKINQYVTTKVKDPKTGGWDAEASDKNFGRFRDELVLMGFTEEAIDDEAPPLFAKGKTVDAIVYAKADKARKSPTPEQLAKGQKQGDPIKDQDGKEVVTYQLAIDSILGLSTTQVGANY